MLARVPTHQADRRSVSIRQQIGLHDRIPGLAVGVRHDGRVGAGRQVDEQGGIGVGRQGEILHGNGRGLDERRLSDRNSPALRFALESPIAFGVVFFTAVALCPLQPRLPQSITCHAISFPEAIRASREGGGAAAPANCDPVLERTCFPRSSRFPFCLRASFPGNEGA